MVWDAVGDREIVLLTNLLEFGPTTIAAIYIYKDRWEIELFFKALTSSHGNWLRHLWLAAGGQFDQCLPCFARDARATFEQNAPLVKKMGSSKRSGPDLFKMCAVSERHFIETRSGGTAHYRAPGQRP